MQLKCIAHKLNINIPDIPSIQKWRSISIAYGAFFCMPHQRISFLICMLFYFWQTTEQFWSTKQFLFFYLFVAISANFASGFII